MLALRYYGGKDLRLDDVDEPIPGPGTVKIKVGWNGICGSDLHEYVSGPHAIPTPERPHPLTGESLPVILGHEFAGTVVEVGEGVVGPKVGDKVAVEPVLRDGSCVACSRGAYNVCDQLGFTGLMGGYGGLAEFSVVAANAVHILPESIDSDVGALIEPLAVGWHAMMRSQFRPGQTAFVLGAGPIGLAVLCALRAAGVRKVAVSEPSPARREIAREFGADLVINPNESDPVAAVLEMTAGAGVDASFDASGQQTTLQAALDSLTPQGTAVGVALWGGLATIDPNAFVFGERRYVGSACYTSADYEAVIAAVADGRMRPSPMITKRVSLHEAVREGFDELIQASDRHVKVLVHP